jgi:hypothetical protein
MALNNNVAHFIVLSKVPSGLYVLYRHEAFTPLPYDNPNFADLWVTDSHHRR